MTAELPTLTAPDDLITELRKLIPNKQLTYGQASTLAKKQANTLRTLIGSKHAAFDLSWLFKRDDLTIELRPEYKMPNHTSGITTRVNGAMVIFLNANEGHLRQRFTLAHELKHALDFDLVDSAYSGLGRGNAKLQADQIEWLCNRFAACLLMPKVWVNRLWSRGLHDPVALAHLFQVSPEAMTIRLRTLGYIGTPQRPADEFFRSDAQDFDATRYPEAA